MKIDISREGYLNLLQEVYDKKKEEREHALDRYRKADDMMDSAEQFVLMGKNAVSFLSLAATSTSDVAALAKEIKSIVYKDSDNASSGDSSELDESFKLAISTQLEEMEQEKNTKGSSNETDNSKPKA